MALAFMSAILLSGCSAGIAAVPASTRPAAGEQTAGPSASSLARSAHEAVNAHRIQGGRTPLQWDDQIAAAAREHSQAMASGRVPFSHAGFDDRAAAIGAALPVGTMAENVAYDGGPARGMSERVIDGWLGSRGHRENIEGDFHATGVGVATAADGRHYFTQIFVQLR